MNEQITAEDLRFAQNQDGVWVTEYRDATIEQSDRFGWFIAKINGEQIVNCNSLPIAMAHVDWYIRDNGSN